MSFFTVGKIKTSAIGLSLIKGFDVAEGGGIELISHLITKHLQVIIGTLLIIKDKYNFYFKIRFHALF